jgi:hypothetical protein
MRSSMGAIGKPYFDEISTRSSMEAFGKPNFDEI